MNCKNWSIDCLYQQLKFDEIQNDYLTQTLVFLAGVFEKNKLMSEKIKLINLF